MNTFVTKSDEISSSNLLFSSTQNLGEGKFIMKDIEDALNNLPQDYYIPFTQYFEGFKYHEIADNLNIPIGTVKTRIHVARKILKNQLKSYDLGNKDLKPVYSEN